MEVNTNATLPSGFIEKHGENSVEEALLLVPTLNEEDAIGSVLTEAHEAGFRMILVVDGFSSDRTRLIAEQSGAIVALQEFGKGKGCGVRTGMQKFLGSRAQFLCIIDGDGTNVPSALLKLIPLVASGNADVVLGSRTRGPREKGAMDMLTLASNLTVSFLLGAKFLRLFTDVQTGYWVFNRNASIQPFVQPASKLKWSSLSTPSRTACE
jgi:dolichol-phosphate mannosyltransferase